jgi:hypothetical protein
MLPDLASVICTDPRLPGHDCACTRQPHLPCDLHRLHLQPQAEVLQHVPGWRARQAGGECPGNIP